MFNKFETVYVIKYDLNKRQVYIGNEKRRYLNNCTRRVSKIAFTR
jgi:tRNA U34 2-thiouridine synthase MnmA/TrmU